MRKETKRKEPPHISSSQFIIANPVVQSDCRIYGSARYVEKNIEFLFVFAYRKMLRRVRSKIHGFWTLISKIR